MPIIITVITIFLALTVNAKPSSGYEVMKSKVSDDLVLNVWAHKAHDNLYNLDGISYQWQSVTNFQIVIEMPKDEYFCFAQMFDSASNAVPLRQAFRNLGKSFFDLRYPSPEQPWSDAIKDVLHMVPAHVTGPSFGQQTRPELFIAHQDVGGGRSFYSLDEIFDLKKPGQYKVRLRFQVYARIYKGGHNFAYKLERSEPLEFAVTKE